MPKATSEKLSRAHRPAVKKKDKDGSGSATNPLFNTQRFGQHILKNTQTAQKIVDAANLKPTDKVLEVGPGTGNLTVKILEKAKHVTAVEMDPRMAAEVLKRVQGTPEQRKLEVIIGDFVKAEIPYFEVCISNTPYQISSPLVFRLLSHRPLFRVAILMFQREFALRLVARPGTSLWSRLSANVQLYAKVDNIMHVNRNDFRPPPQVESSVIRLVPLDPPPPVKFEEFDGLNRIIFSRPNKTVRGNFQAKGVMKMLEQNRNTWLSMQSMAVDNENTSINELLDKILEEGGWTESRAAKMDIDEILKLLAAFHEVGIHFS
ncbi:rRNA (adenine-N6,N6-)-dimethyltransferase [Coprinopsis cinerea okayama7|uniref:rRNA adenine N(6)-methyltransferase n=1 Tax=Coprinopsis cinerea (strain Okayama-7 / 130 / ATCC MYA-4618 / FGSC 9003) TaxID=240176 RepID=A8NJ30_COPC7|nr:rRNA (adenine-N6,N6-)-dimethyltransferase [Coprinopsis cinerea okayama7\|eukprot:XP_001834135.2 rRNA (adenine-N6,N6-)-dimethyltransferase [Coprinopsis cinerea okayama7\